ncbi:MAG: universal stress protein [Knoellia sp.]
MSDAHAEHSSFAAPLSDTAGQPVVVGYDGSTEGDKALGWAAGFAALCGVPLQIVYAVEPPDGGGGDPFGAVEPEEWPGRATGVARRGANHVLRQHPNLRVEADGAVGNPAAEIVMRSATASVVVVGRRTTQPVDALGSVSFAVGAHARCPAVVVPSASTPLLGPRCPVVVGIDGSASSRHAVTFAADVALRAGAELILVSAWTRPSREPWMAGPDEAHDDRPRSGKSAEHSAAVQVVRGAADLVHRLAPDLPTVQVVRQGPAHEVLLQASGEAGLLVVGSRGAGGFVGLQVGSVSRALLRHATIPVAVVPQGSSVDSRPYALGEGV